MNNLLEVKGILDSVAETSSTMGKQNIIKEYKDNELFKKVLLYTYDKNKKYKVSRKSIVVRKGKSKWNDLFEMLDELAASNINNDLKINIGKFLGELHTDAERELVTKILLKDLKIGVSIKTINKCIEGLIFDFQVMKASAYNDKTKIGFINKAKKQGYTMSIKDNGERGIVIKENGKIVIKTRQDKIYEGLIDLEKEFEFMPDNYVYEGELLAFEPNGLEWKTSEDQFKLTNKILHTDGVKSGIYINLFDMIPLNDFKNGISHIKAKDRKEMCKDAVKLHEFKYIRYETVLYQGTDTELIDKKLVEVSSDSWKEGLMVILNDSIYESKRVNYSLKCKLWHTMDLKVIGLNESIEKPGSLGSLMLDYKGEQQGCSGISDDLKTKWWNNPDDIINKIVEVKYKSVTKDKDGNESLQFCNFIRVRHDKDDVSYD